METKVYNFDVTRNGVTVRVLIEDKSHNEALLSLTKFLSENTSSYVFQGYFTKETK